MQNKNICKFISPSIQDSLSVSCFVLESDRAVMTQNNLLKEHRVILVTQGEGEFLFGESRVPFSAGTLVFGFKNESFTVQITDGGSYIYISFDGSRADELFRRFDIRKDNRKFDGFDGLIPLWSESLSRANEQTVDLASESMLLYTFSRLSSNSVSRTGIIGKILQITEENFTDPELSLTTLAQILAYNPKYVSYVFKDKMGVSYSEYLRTTRIKFAVSLFDRGLDSVKNVAFLSGFTDPLYFSTVFKKQIGVSPKEYKDGKGN